MRLGGSSGPAILAACPAASATNRASAAVSTPASLAILTYGKRRFAAYQSGHRSASLLGNGNPAMVPGHGAPNRSAPNLCNAARSPPNWAAASALAPPGSTHSSTRQAGSHASTAGTGTAPASASHCSPAASAASPLRSPLPSPSEGNDATLANAARPSAVVRRRCVTPCWPPRLRACDTPVPSSRSSRARTLASMPLQDGGELGGQ